MGNLPILIKSGNKQQLKCAINRAIDNGVYPSDPNLVSAKMALASPRPEDNPDKQHPSRTEIAGMEPMCARWAEGGLSKAMMLGDAVGLEMQIQQFVEQMQIDPVWLRDPLRRRRMLLPKGMTETNAPEIWKEADINNDGTLSEAEARELLRIFLSRSQLRRALGKPLMKAISERAEEEPDFAKSLADDGARSKLRQLCEHVVSRACGDVAKTLPDSVTAFWRLMDVNGNGDIDKSEFCRNFASAIMDVVVSQIWL